MSTAIVNHWKSSVEWLKFCVNFWYPYIKLLHEQLLKGLLNSILIFDCLSQFRPLDCTIVFHRLLCLSQNSYIQMSINHFKMEKWKFKQDHMVELVPGFLAFLNEEVSRKEQICMLTKKKWKKRRFSGKEIAVSLKTTVWPCTGPLLVSVDSEPGTPRVVWIELTKRFSYLRSSRLTKLIVSKCEIVGKPTRPLCITISVVVKDNW